MTSALPTVTEEGVTPAASSALIPEAAAVKVIPSLTATGQGPIAGGAGPACDPSHTCSVQVEKPVAAPATVIHHPHGRLRYWLFVSLEVSAGVLDSFSLIYLGGVFCAYITGSMVILGVNIARPSDAGQSIAPPLLALFAFCVGSYCAGRVRRLWPKSAVLRPVQHLLIVQVIFLVPVICLAGAADLQRRGVQYVAIVLLALAGAFLMAASIALSVSGLPSPMATNLVHRVFVDDPFQRGNRIRSLRPAAVVLALITGGTVGSAIGRSGQPWIVVLLGTIISLIAIAVLEVMSRRDLHAGE